MASVTIRLEDGGNTIRMPKLCMVCGKPGCRQKRTVFQADYTTWGGFGRGGTRFLYTSVPLCNQHYGHFDAYTYLGYAVAAIMFLLIGGAALLALAFNFIWGIPIAIAAGFITMLAYAVTAWVMKFSLVHATSITTSSITLTNVHQTFADAVTGRRSRKSRRDDDHDDYDDYEDGYEGSDRQRPRRSRRDDADHDYGDRDREPRSNTGFYILLGVIGFFVLFFVIIGIVMLVMIMNLRGPRPGPGPAPGPGVQQPGGAQPSPLPIDPTWDEKAMRPSFLSDMKEYDAQVGYGSFGKNGLMGYAYKTVPAEKNRITFKGELYPKGLSTAPPTAGAARVKYRLDGKYKLFRGAAAMADLPADSEKQEAVSPVVFSVLGDGRLLWASRPLQKKGDVAGLRLSVAGVNELELRAHCAGLGHYTWAVWLEPCVLE